MSENKTYAVAESLKTSAWIDEETYFKEYQRSLNDAEGFWAERPAAT